MNRIIQTFFLMQQIWIYECWLQYNYKGWCTCLKRNFNTVPGNFILTNFTVFPFNNKKKNIACFRCIFSILLVNLRKSDYYRNDILCIYCSYLRFLVNLCILYLLCILGFHYYITLKVFKWYIYICIFSIWRIEVKSRMFDACLVIDGGLSFTFNDGSTALLEINDEDSLLTIKLPE